MLQCFSSQSIYIYFFVNAAVHFEFLKTLLESFTYLDLTLKYASLDASQL